jgi:hypothetical protein
VHEEHNWELEMYIKNVIRFVGFSLTVIFAVLNLGCATPANLANITINSEPQGAKLFWQGQYMGTTPYNGTWALEPSHYDTGTLTSPDAVLVKDGYLPVRKDYRLNINPQWRPDPNVYSTGGHTFYFHDLVVLQRDPT